MASGAKTYQLNVMLDIEDKTHLDMLRDATKKTLAQIVREAITNYWMMRICRTPTCADGQRCLVPQMHTMLPQPPIAPPAPTTAQ